MSRRRRLRFLASGVIGALSATAVSAGVHDLVISDVRVVDVDQGHVSAPLSVGVDAGTIAAVSMNRLDGRNRIEGGGRFLLPGLWDMHVHATWTAGLWPLAARQFVANCVTGVRDMGGTVDELEQARAFDGPAPRLVAAGSILDGPQPVDPSISVAISDANEVRQAVGRLAGKADFIKVYTLFPATAFADLMAEARQRSMPVAGHVPHGISPADASRLGMRSIEHMQAETGLYCDPLSPESCRPLLDTFRRNSTWQTPTLVARAVRAHRSPSDLDLAFKAVRDFPRAVRSLWSRERARLSSEAPQSIERKRSDFDRERALARLLIDNHVPVLAGTDAGLPFVPYGRSLHEELRLLVEAGASPAGALRAAITEPARYFGKHDMGRIRRGAPADFCLLDKNPLEELNAAGRPLVTVVNGRIVFTRN